MREQGGDLVVVSSGFHKTHVTTAAGEINQRGLLRLAITGAYPTARAKRVLRALRLSDRGRVARLMEREEPIPETKLRPLFIPELLDEAARLIARIAGLSRLYRSVSAATWRLYGRRAARRLDEADGARTFLYRAGFGGRSIHGRRELHGTDNSSPSLLYEPSSRKAGSGGRPLLACRRIGTVCRS